MKLTFPPPVSANRYWRHYRGRMVVSAEAKAYKQHVGWIAKSRGAFLTNQPVRVSIDVYRPARRGDLDNAIKVLLDAMQGILYCDDRQVVEIHARRFDDPANPRVEVEVTGT